MFTLLMVLAVMLIPSTQTGTIYNNNQLCKVEVVAYQGVQPISRVLIQPNDYVIAQLPVDTDGRPVEFRIYGIGCNWQSYTYSEQISPALEKFTLYVEANPRKTWIALQQNK